MAKKEKLAQGKSMSSGFSSAVHDNEIERITRTLQYMNSGSSDPKSPRPDGEQRFVSGKQSPTLDYKNGGMTQYGGFYFKEVPKPSQQ